MHILQTIPNLKYASATSLQSIFENSGLVRFDSAQPFGANASTFINCWKDCSNLRDFPQDNLIMYLKDLLKVLWVHLLVRIFKVHSKVVL